MIARPAPPYAIPFFANYIDRLKALCDELDLAAVSRLSDALLRARQSGHNIFIAGNGGSAATSLHMACDLAMLAAKSGGKPFRAHSLNGSAAIMTASANDRGYERVFVDQLVALFRPGDLLVVISASGDSENLVRATQWIQDHGGICVGLLGFDGGRLAQLCTTSVIVRTPRGEYGLVEDMHIAIAHMLSDFLRTRMEH